ncbi:MAG: hypothetical protein A2X36_04825 [Elusimicrobia bacterium GWA2_69_24]|nr:MAG: hypothetical protein A2X36_04825 [Elusimicrobia bacterium GWA2_69_24]HBL17504.1 hypothetical protein [Elusimicrobiota bacterium]
MKLRLAALAGVVTVLAVLFLVGKEDYGPFGWTNWLAPTSDGWERVGQGSSLDLVEGPPSVWKRHDPGRRDAGTDKSSRFRKLTLDEELRDALGPTNPVMLQFWQNAFSGIRSIRRDPDGGLRASIPSARSAFPTSRWKARTVKGPDKSASDTGIVTRWVQTIQDMIHRGKTRSGGAAPLRVPASGGSGSAKSIDFDGHSAARSGGGGMGFALGHSAESSAGGRRSGSRGTEEARERAKRPHVMRLADWIGRERVEPPTGKLTAPSFTALKDKFPAALPDGKPYSRKTPEPRHFDKLITPGEHRDYEKWLEKDEHRGAGSKPHWHIDARDTPFYHIGTSWGRSDGGSWAWMILSSRRWWTAADGAQRMVRYEENWWWRTQDGWFLLRNGEPWGWRHFAEWRRNGLIHPGTGTKIFYSEDGNRIVVSVPGEGSSVFDARTGQFIWRFADSGRRSAPSEDEISALGSIGLD